jgi:hypothetical protein
LRPRSIQEDSAPELLEILVGGRAHDDRFVDTFDGMTRMRQLRGKLAVTGQQQQPFAVEIEATDRINVLTDAFEQFDDRTPALRILSRRHDVLGLVHDDVPGADVELEAAPVDFDEVVCGVGFAAERANDLAVHFDTALRDEFFGRATRGHASHREQLL